MRPPVLNLGVSEGGIHLALSHLYAPYAINATAVGMPTTGTINSTRPPSTYAQSLGLLPLPPSLACSSGSLGSLGGIAGYRTQGWVISLCRCLTFATGKGYKLGCIMYIMTIAAVPFRGRVIVTRRGEVRIYVNRRDEGGRILAGYNGARVAGIVVVLRGGKHG